LLSQKDVHLLNAEMAWENTECPRGFNFKDSWQGIIVHVNAPGPVVIQWQA